MQVHRFDVHCLLGEPEPQLLEGLRGSQHFGLQQRNNKFNYEYVFSSLVRSDLYLNIIMNFLVLCNGISSLLSVGLSVQTCASTYSLCTFGLWLRHRSKAPWLEPLPLVVENE